MKTSEEIMEEALREIALGRGPYNPDQLQHAQNTIEEMKTVAQNALDQAAVVKING